MPNIQKNTIIYSSEDWLAGMHPQYQATSAGTAKITSGLSQATAFNPFTFLGYASPGEDAQAVSNASVIDAEIQRIIPKSSTVSYMIEGDTAGGSDASLHLLNPTGIITNAAPWPHTITPHSGDVQGKDCVLYNIGTTQYLFYSWRDNSSIDGDIGRYDLSSTFYDSWLSDGEGGGTNKPANGEVLTATNKAPAPLIVGDDDILYIGDGNKVKSLDGQTPPGANGTFNNNVLLLPSDNIIEGFAKISPRTLAIFTSARSAIDQTGNHGSRGYVYLWDYINSDPYQVFDLGDGRLGSPFVYKTTIGCFQLSPFIDFGNSSRQLQLKLYDGSQFKSVANILSGQMPTVGGVDVIGDDLIVFQAGGNVYSWNSPIEGIGGGLNIIASPSGTDNGAIKWIGGIGFVSSGSGATNGLQQFNGKHDTGSVATAYAIPSFPADYQGQITQVDIVFGKTSTGGRDIDLQFLDMSGNTTTIFTDVEDITSTNLIKKYMLDSSGNPLPTFEGLKCILKWGAGTGNTDAPIVDKVIVHYEQVKHND